MDYSDLGRAEHRPRRSHLPAFDVPNIDHRIVAPAVVVDRDVQRLRSIAAVVAPDAQVAKR